MRFDVIRRCALALAIVCGTTDASLAAVVNVYYNPVTGNLKLQNTTASAVKLLSYQIVTIGDGTYGPVAPGGQGYLTGVAANTPSPTPGWPISNTEAGSNGLFSEIYAANTYVGPTTAPVLTLSAYSGWSAANPTGPAGSFFDLGNVATVGMSQSDLNTRFITVADLTPGFVTLGGSLLFDYEVSSGTFNGTTPGDVVALVPEPSMFMLAAAAAGVGVMRLVRSGGRRLPLSAAATDHPRGPRDDDAPPAV